ncbi:MAG: Wzz/FepE/Etk N-terminal domain-containing protein [Terriglobia bacterium]
MSYSPMQRSSPGPDDITPTADPAAWERVSTRDVLSIVFKYKWLIAGVFVSAVLATLLALWIRPPQYEVEARILIKYGKDISANPRSSMAPTANQMVSASRPDVNTEAEMIRSYALVEKVVRELKLDQPQQPVVPPDLVSRLRYQMRAFYGSISGALDEVQYRLALKERLTPKETAIMEILNGLKVEGVKDSSVIDIKLQTKFRKDSSVVLNRLVDAYRESRLGIERTPEVERFFLNEANQYGQRLKQSESRLNALKQQTQSASLPDQIGMQTRIIAESEHAVNESANKLAEASAQARLLQQQLSAEKPTAVLEQVQARNSLLDDLNQKRATLLLRQQELLSKYTDNDVHVQDVNQQLATLTKMIADADQDVKQSSTTGENSVYVDLRKQAATATRQRDAVQARLTSEQRELAGYRQKLGSLQTLEPEYNQLARAVEMDGESYKLYQRNAAEARAAENLNSQGITSIAFMDPAVDPILPSGMRRIYVFMGAVIGGLILGLGLAFLAEALGHTIGKPDQLVRHSGLPVLSVFPLFGRGHPDEEIVGIAAAGVSNISRAAQSLADDTRNKTLLFFGANRNAGTTTVARRFAEAFRSELNERVLLVSINPSPAEAARGRDLSQPELSSGQASKRGADEGYLVADLSAEQITSHLGNVALTLPEYDRILIDLSTRLPREKQLEIARECAAVVIVVEAEKTKFEVLEWTRREFRRIGVPVLGAVLNKRQFHIPEFIYRRV